MLVNNLNVFLREYIQDKLKYSGFGQIEVRGAYRDHNTHLTCIPIILKINDNSAYSGKPKIMDEISDNIDFISSITFNELAESLKNEIERLKSTSLSVGQLLDKIIENQNKNKPKKKKNNQKVESDPKDNIARLKIAK